MRLEQLIVCITCVFFTSCNGQGSLSQNSSNTNIQYEEIGQTSISFGEHTSILGIQPTNDNHHLLYLRSNQKTNRHKYDFHFLKINQKGDSISSLPVSFDHFLTTYIEYDNSYFVVTTDVRTMGGYTMNYLEKYDKNWKQIWSKKIEKPKYPDGSTALTLTENKELLLVSDEFFPKSAKSGISFQRYTLDGDLISQNLLMTEGISNPISLIKSGDGNYFLTAEQYDRTENINSLWLLKLTQEGDTIWTKKYSHFYAKETLLTRSGDLIFYGSNYSSAEEKKVHYHYLKILVLDQGGNLKWRKEFKQNYYEKPGNMVETNTGNYLFSSTITPIKDKGDRGYIFELDGDGRLMFERKFEYPIGIGSVPFLIKSENQITMVCQKWIGQFGDPFHDIILITKFNN